MLKWRELDSSSIVARLNALLRSEQIASDNERMVARATNALPVYFDMSGALSITADGSVLFFDWESEEIRPIKDERWIMIAAVSAAEKYPDLRGLIPDRPPTAKTCPLCAGSGIQSLTPRHETFCGQCCGLGWVS